VADRAQADGAGRVGEQAAAGADDRRGGHEQLSCRYPRGPEAVVRAPGDPLGLGTGQAADAVIGADAG